MGKRNKQNRMAGDAITGQPDSNDVARGAMNNRRDWSQPNWDNPSKKEQRKFKKATGYDQYLGGFREGHIEDMYKDQRIDWWANDNSHNKIYRKLAKNTGLNYNRVQNQDEAEILNYNERGAAFTVNRTDKDKSNNVSGHSDQMVTTHEAFGPISGQGTRLAGAAGISTAWDVKQYGSFIPELSEFDDKFQTNRTVAFTGEEVKNNNYKTPYKGAEVAGYTPGVGGGEGSGNWDKMAKQMNQHTRAHEVGHSMGIAGDLTLNKKDPSLMSYNTSIRSGKMGTREYESIKKNFAPYINDSAYVPYTAPAPVSPTAPPTPPAVQPTQPTAAASQAKSRARRRRRKA